MTLPATVEVRVEVPRGSRIKRGADGRIDFLSPVRCPFNYGSVPGVAAPDGDPVDAIVLGAPLPLGDQRSWPVHGVVRFVDRGARDDKLICGAAPPTPEQRAEIERFFRWYGRVKRVAALARGDVRATRSEGVDPP